MQSQEIPSTIHLSHWKLQLRPHELFSRSACRRTVNSDTCTEEGESSPCKVPGSWHTPASQECQSAGELCQSHWQEEELEHCIQVWALRKGRCAPGGAGPEEATELCTFLTVFIPKWFLRKERKSWAVRNAEPRGAASVCLLNIIQSCSCNTLLGHAVFCSQRCLCQLSPTVVQYIFEVFPTNPALHSQPPVINNSSMWDRHSAQTFYCAAYKVSERAKEFPTRLPNKIFHSLPWAQPLLHIWLCLVMKDILPVPKHLSKRADIWKVTSTRSSRTADARSDVCSEINQAAAAAAPSPSPISITCTEASCTGTHHSHFFFTLSTTNHGNLSPQLKRADISGTPLLTP